MFCRLSDGLKVKFCLLMIHSVLVYDNFLFPTYQYSFWNWNMWYIIIESYLLMYHVLCLYTFFFQPGDLGISYYYCLYLQSPLIFMIDVKCYGFSKMHFFIVKYPSLCILHLASTCIFILLFIPYLCLACCWAPPSFPTLQKNEYMR